MRCKIRLMVYWRIFSRSRPHDKNHHRINVLLILLRYSSIFGAWMPVKPQWFGMAGRITLKQSEAHNPVFTSKGLVT